MTRALISRITLPALILMLFVAPVAAEHCGKYSPDTVDYEWCLLTHYQEEYLQEQAGIYCQGEGCPTRYLIEGFEVWMSPSLEDNPAYTDEYLDRYLDVIQAQLLYMDSVGVIPQEAMNALRDSGLTIYIDDPDNQQEWWPCDPGPSGCYSPSTNQIGGSFWGNVGNVLNGWHWQSFILHEAAHAYHGQVIYGRFDNPCILDAYERNRHRYYRVENSARASGIPPHEGVQIVQHWAYRTAFEYFAELSEAYFFRGTSYPWNRIELYRHDPEGYYIVRDAWNDPAFCDSGPTEYFHSIWSAHEQLEQARREEAEREALAEREAAELMSFCTIAVASFGGKGGLPFFPAAPWNLAIRAGDWIDALILNDHQYGGYGGRQGHVLEFIPGEYINRAVIGAGVYVDRLEFYTNMGRSIIGGRGMDASNRVPSNLDNIRVIRIGGRSSTYLNQIEVTYCADYES